MNDLAQRRTKAKRFLRWAAPVSLGAGLFLLAYCGFQIGRAALWQRYQSWKLDRRILNGNEPRSGAPQIANTGTQRGLSYHSAEEVPDHEEHQESFSASHRPFDAAGPSPSKQPGRDEAASSGVIGRLSIARLGLSAIIRNGTDDETLNLSVGHLPGSALPGEPGNVVLAGHRDTFFHSLRSAQKNDKIVIFTPGGAHQYLVDSMMIVDPWETQVLRPTTQPTLTLVTCYPFSYIGPAPQRFIVQAKEVSSAAAAETRRSSSLAAGHSPAPRQEAKAAEPAPRAAEAPHRRGMRRSQSTALSEIPALTRRESDPPPAISQKKHGKWARAFRPFGKLAHAIAHPL